MDIRERYTHPPDFYRIAADYTQLELRIMAEIKRNLEKKCEICDGKGFYHKEWGRSLIPHPCPKCPRQSR